MGTVTVTTTPVQLDDGSHPYVNIGNTGAQGSPTAVVTIGSRTERFEPGFARRLTTGGVAVTAATAFGTTTLAVDTTGQAPMPGIDDAELQAYVEAAVADLALGDAAALDVGTGAGTVAAGNDPRITDAAQKSANLSDLGSTATSRTNLGLASASTMTPAGLAADAALTAAFARSDAAGISVAANGADLTGATDASTAVAATLASAAPGGVVVIPAGATVRLNSTVSIPAGVTLLNKGTISLGTGATVEVSAARAVLSGGTVSTTTAGAAYMARIGRDNAVIENVRFTGTTRTAAVRVSYEADPAQAGTITGAAIRNNIFDGVCYAVLKMLVNTITVGFHITGNRFANITGGDAIEWNVGSDDRELLIAHNIIDGVARGAVTNAGIGIGIAGGSYGGALNTQSRQFAIIGNVINNAAEGIHVEACNRFAILGNFVSNITETTELTGAGVQVYGSTRFAVRGNTITDSTKGVAIQYGGGGFLQCDKYVVAGNDTFSCGIGIKVWCEGVDYHAKVVANTLTDCTLGLEARGVGNWTIEGNTASGCGGHDLNFTLINTGLAAQVPVSLALANNVFHDAVNNAVLTVAGVSNFSTVREAGNNFTLAQALKSQGRLLYGTTTPKAVEVRVGDVIMNTAGPGNGAPLGWLCTTAGSQQKISDTYYFTAGVGNAYVVITSPGDPGNAFSPGQRIVLAGAGPAGAALTTTITNTYVQSAEYRVGITSTVSTAVGSSTAITLPSTSAFKTLHDVSPLAGKLASGQYYFTCGDHSTTTAGSLGVAQLRVYPWLVPVDVTINRLGAEVTTVGDAGSHVRLGIYADNGSGYPGALVLDAGQILGDSATVQELTVSQALPAGLYWAGGAVQDVTTTQPTLRMPTAAGGGFPDVPLRIGSSIPGAGAVLNGYQQASVTGALPSTFISTVTTGGSGPRTFFKVA